MNPSAILGMFLAVSVLLNGWQYHQHDKLVATAATAETVARGVSAAAESCTASVDKLATVGKEQTAKTLAAIAAQQPVIDRLNTAALQSLRAKPSNPKDLCASMQIYWQAQIRKERGKP